jgi:hypothetical protein
MGGGPFRKESSWRSEFYMNEMLLFARRVVLFIILVLSLGLASQGSHGGAILQLSGGFKFEVQLL